MNSTRAVAAGLIGTASMTALLLIEPSLGLPNIAIGQILSGAAIGWCIHFGVGVVFALVYAAVFVRRLPGGPFVRGVLYGGLIFLLAQLIFMPLVGGGVFSRGDAEMIAGSLLGHLVYGGVVGWIYSLQSAASR
jgi:uncharacterized membrane protein YagU involved in acid resistance